MLLPSVRAMLPGWDENRVGSVAGSGGCAELRVSFSGVGEDPVGVVCGLGAIQRCAAMFTGLR